MKRKKNLFTYILICCGIVVLVMGLTRSCFYSINQPFLRHTGKLIDKEKSGRYYAGFGMYSKNIYYWKNEVFGDTPIKMENADKETFKVLAEYFAKDKNGVYYESTVDTQVDASTFEVIAAYDNPDPNFCWVMKDNQHVYQFGNIVPSDEKKVFEIVQDANPAYFQHIGNEWSKDDQHVFFRYQKVDADVNTFANLNNYFSRDSNFLFSVRSTPSDDKTNVTYKIEKLKCNGNELEGIPENNNYVRTKTALYYNKEGNVSGVQIKETSDIESFYDDMWLKIDGKIVICGAWLTKPEVDANTFVSIGGDFFKDEKQVYFWKRNTRDVIPIDNADIQTFVNVGGYYAKDKNHVYYTNNLVPDANPQDFSYDETSGYGHSDDNVYVDGAKKTK
ncbi:MAG: DKNYY domain-containing protein [Tannerella sp.]|jgi:hypothetical protein|nr:DKNYY domain-containing protein [Tannerella sp.]